MTEKEKTIECAESVAGSFWSFYESKGWMVGKNKMKNWKAAVSGWLIREKKNEPRSEERTEWKRPDGQDYARMGG